MYVYFIYIVYTSWVKRVEERRGGRLGVAGRKERYEVCKTLLLGVTAVPAGTLAGTTKYNGIADDAAK